MTRFRRNMVLGGLGGLLACGLLTTLSVWLLSSGVLTPPLSYRVVALLIALVFGGFSLAEIPLMVFSMRRLIAERHDNRVLVWGLNAFYVFFAAVYGVPVLLLTGSAGWGLALCGLSLIRLVASLMFVRESPA